MQSPEELLSAEAGTRHLSRAATSLIINTGGTAALGIAFWAVAARKFDAAEVGRDGALLSALVELSTICQLNLDNALPRFLPVVREQTRKLLYWAFIASGIAAIVVGTGFVLLAPAVSDEFDFLRSGLIAPGFVISLVLWGWFALQCSSLVGLRRAPWVPIATIIFAVVKLVALVALAATTISNGIFLAWVLPVLPILIPIGIAILIRIAPAHALLPAPGNSVVRAMRRRELVRFQAQDYLASILARATTTLLPLLVVAMLGPSENAYFFIPFTMAIAFDLLFYGAAMSLVVEGSYDEGRAHDLARTVVRRFALPLGAASLALVAGAHLILLPFGEAYASNGATALRILALGSLFRIVLALYVALERVAGRGRRILIVETSLMVLLVPLAVILGSSMGINGVATAWTVANAIVAAALLPSLVRRIRRGPRI